MEHVKILIGYVVYEYTGINPFTNQPYISPKRQVFFPELKGNLVKDYPIMDNVTKYVRKEDVIKEIKNFFQLADSNDVIYIHNNGEGPGFRIEVGLNKDDYEMIHIPEMVDIMKSTPREGKLILVNDTCGAEWYIRTLKEAMIREGSPLKDFVGIGAVSAPPNMPAETSSGTFEFIFLSKLRDGYSIRDAVPSEFRELIAASGGKTYWDKELSHPVIYTGEGDYSWLDSYNPFGLAKENKATYPS
jgi:hypothetical protein